MENTATLRKRSKRANPYLVKEIMEATPKQLLLKVYDFALLNCQKGDMVMTNKAISELIYALNYETEETREISIELLKIYQFTQEQTRKGNYGLVYKILSGLRNTWQDVFERKDSPN